MQSKQSREEDVADAARLELFQVLMSFSVGSIKKQAPDQPSRAGSVTAQQDRDKLQPPRGSGEQDEFIWDFFSYRMIQIHSSGEHFLFNFRENIFLSVLKM